ncbi:MAG TPA: hypothetical protein VMB72_08225 [Acidimicrobiales bacterium]|nr:hypothetical protein [Acidimicrobiales bacterium]
MGVIRTVATAARRLTGAGAVHNARLEVDAAARTARELELQLSRVPPPAQGPEVARAGAPRAGSSSAGAPLAVAVAPTVPAPGGPERVSAAPSAPDRAA